MSNKNTWSNAVKSEENCSDLLVWNKKIPNPALQKFKKIIEEKYNLRFITFWDFHTWTVDNFPSFWEEVWINYGVVFSKPYEEVFVKTGSGFLDNKWFVGAELNYAENILKIRDSREALLCLDEDGNYERVTFAEMYEQVKLYAAAFRKQGLQKGDIFACYMSNRKEAVFAILAASSIGAISGGTHPFSGIRDTTNIIQRLEAKILITVDRFSDELSKGKSNLLANLPFIAENSPTIECIIIVPTKKETLQMDISHIPNSCFLDDFLETGRDPDGKVPELVFEQLPFKHPVYIIFSSGTTGLPKGPMHSVGCHLGPLSDFALHYDLKRGDTIYSFYTMGWIMWNYYISALSLGVRLFLHNGNPFALSDGRNMWDLLAEHKVSYLLLLPTILDRMEKMELKPKPNTNFENLKYFFLGGSTMKLQNYTYIKSIVSEDVFIGNLYGCTENFAAVTGADRELPAYACNIQVPAFGRDLQIFDRNGRSVIDKNGEVVITKPCPNFMIGIWKDVNNEILNRTYLSKFPGVWQQRDEGCINSQTKGLKILGRSDDIFTQSGETFGANDIYFAIHGMEEIVDYICVDKKTADLDSIVILFIQLKEGHSFTPQLKEKVARKIESELFVECVPKIILPVKSIPYNAANKRVENLVRKIVATNQVPEEANVKNPECLEEYCNRPEIVNFKE